MDPKDERNGLQEIIDKAPGEAGGAPAPEGIDLAEFRRRTGLARLRARTIKSRGLKALPHGRTGGPRVPRYGRAGRGPGTA